MFMLLSDRDIRKAYAGGRISLDPWDSTMVQPASVDVRLDRFFRVFNNYTASRRVHSGVYLGIRKT